MEVRRRAAVWLESLADRLGITPWTLLAGTVAIGAASFGGWWAFAAPAPPPVDEVLPRVEEAGPVVSVATTAPASEAVVAPLVVHVDGAVAHAGVHELETGARVVDAVEAAGGLAAEADRSRLNLAEPLTDGQRVWVPRVGEVEPEVLSPTGGAASEGSNGGGDAGALIDLNHADEAELEELPGVGPTIAGAIVSHREEVGSFQQPEDLLEVSGIGPARFAQIEPLVTV